MIQSASPVALQSGFLAHFCSLPFGKEAVTGAVEVSLVDLQLKAAMIRLRTR